MKEAMVECFQNGAKLTDHSLYHMKELCLKDYRQQKFFMSGSFRISGTKYEVIVKRGDDITEATKMIFNMIVNYERLKKLEQI
jgi:hypothetical protein